MEPQPEEPHAARRLAAAVLWAPRAILAVVLAYTAYGALAIDHDPPLWLASDEVEHCWIAYAITALLAVCLPGVPLLAIAGALIAIETGFEYAQAWGVISGQFELRDLAAGVAGVVGALLPMVAVRLRDRRKGCAKPTPEA